MYNEQNWGIKNTNWNWNNWNTQSTVFPLKS